MTGTSGHKAMNGTRLNPPAHSPLSRISCCNRQQGKHRQHRQTARQPHTHRQTAVCHLGRSVWRGSSSSSSQCWELSVVEVISCEVTQPHILLSQLKQLSTHTHTHTHTHTDHWPVSSVLPTHSCQNDAAQMWNKTRSSISTVGVVYLPITSLLQAAVGVTYYGGHCWLNERETTLATVNTDWQNIRHVTYHQHAHSLSINDPLKRYSPTAKILQTPFWHNWAALHKISTDIILHSLCNSCLLILWRALIMT